MSNVVVVGEELLDLPFLQLDQVEDSLHAYQLAKRANWPRRSAGASAARGSTRSAPELSSRLTVGPRSECACRDFAEESRRGHSNSRRLDYEQLQGIESSDLS